MNNIEKYIELGKTIQKEELEELIFSYCSTVAAQYQQDPDKYNEIMNLGLEISSQLP